MPNINKLAMNGIRLENHYVQASCSPSRSALLTGKYPTNTGMQVITYNGEQPKQPIGLFMKQTRDNLRRNKGQKKPACP